MQNSGGATAQSPAIPQSLVPLPADGIVVESVSPPGATLGPTDEFTIANPPMLGPIDPYTGACPTVCAPSPRFALFFEGLYLQPGNAEVVYAIEKDGCDPVLSVPTGPVGRITPDADYGFRTGFGFWVAPEASFVFAYSWFENDESSSITTTPNTTNVLESQITHMSMEGCSLDSLSASADQTIRFQFADIEYHRSLCATPGCDVTLVGGVRYGRLDQNFHASQLIGTPSGLAEVDADVRFDGVGLRVGLLGERVSYRSGLMVYGRGFANFLGGEIDAHYTQVNQFSPTIARNHEDHRIVTVLEAEVGTGWISRNQRWRILVGYQVNAWFNALTTSDWIGEARSGTIDTADSTLTFDGVIARLEYRR